MERIDTIAGVIEAVGGAEAATRLVGAKYRSTADNWVWRGIIPREHFFPLSEALKRLGKEPDPALFGFQPAPAAP